MGLLGKRYEVALWDIFISLGKEDCFILGKTRENLFVIFLIFNLYPIFLFEVLLVVY
jgi:hypothetical protein